MGEASDGSFSGRRISVPVLDRRAALSVVGGAWIGLGTMTKALAASPADAVKIYFAHYGYLGRVDGYCQDDAASECDERGVVLRGFLAT